MMKQFVLQVFKPRVYYYDYFTLKLNRKITLKEQRPG